MVQGQRFPRCAKCDDGVMFELIQAATPGFMPSEQKLRIYLYELPELEEDSGTS